MKKISFVFLVVALFSVFSDTASADHSWGSYHWARIANPLVLKLGDNVSSVWDTYLSQASSDWSASLALDTAVVTGQSSQKNCRPTAGRVEVCNNKYGNNGWLGIAQIWVNESHITQTVTKVNDTYFSRVPYNTAAWKQFVVCQEIGHAFGLDHQDENFSNINLGTCMDYTNDPNGLIKNQLSNEHPNQHDYDELGIIYTHFDSFTSALSSVFNKKTSASASVDGNDDNTDTSDKKEWGREMRKSNDGRSSFHERDLGKGNKVFTFVIWAE